MVILMSDEEYVARNPDTGEWMTEDDVIGWLRARGAPETDISVAINTIQMHRDMGLTVSGDDLRDLVGDGS